MSMKVHRRRRRGQKLPKRHDVGDEFDEPARCLFAIELTKLLRTSRITQGELAEVMTTQGQAIDRTGISRMTTGHRIPPAVMVDLISVIFRLDDDRRSKLHRAAAMDRGYRIGEMR